jgi:hypothetical protein
MLSARRAPRPCSTFVSNLGSELARNRKRTRSPFELTRREKNEMNARLRQFRAMEERKRSDEDETAASPQHNPPDTSEPNLPKRLDVERLTSPQRPGSITQM